MEFGKLHDISMVDFSLPKAHEKTKLVLNEYVKSTLPNIYVGCTGWGMPQWNNSWYPKSTKSKDYLKEYSRQFNTIEHNTTHYRIPDVDTVLRWKTESAEGFKFCPKIPQTISHHHQLGLNGTEIKLFCENIALLEEKMGCCFMQLPPHFIADRLPILEHFLEKWSSEIPLAIEVRNEQFFEYEKPAERFFSLLEKYNISSVITDVAGRRDVLHQRLTTATAMIRFVGNDLHSTDYQRIDRWITQIAAWFEEGLQSLYFFSHQPENLKSPEMAVYFIEKLNLILKSKVVPPKRFDEIKNEQMSLF
jgi:uncharacterized protein YecE (DUF72 family)